MALRGGLFGITLLLTTPALADGLVEVPSGQEITFHEVVLSAPGPQGLTARFRFIAPRISHQIAHPDGPIDHDTAVLDMDHLCTHYALPRLQTVTGPMPQEVVISLADRAVEFGTSAPEATQFFEAYSVKDGTCQWEAF